MVRGLAIRRFFVLVDLALAAIVVVMGGLLSLRVMQPVDAALPDDARPPRAPGGHGVHLAEVGPLATYDAITKYGLFGEAGRFDPSRPPEKPPEPVSEAVVITDLNLRLTGTIALPDRDRAFSCAFIQNLDKNKGNPESYLLGDEVVENVTLEEIQKRQVILLNKQKTPPVRERLCMDDEEEQPSGPPVNPMRTASLRGSDRIEVSKAEIRDELMNNYSDLLKIQPKEKRDARGNVIGLTADNIGQYPLAQKLGLEDGDVLQTVNNEKIDSQAKIMELIQKHQNASSFRIGILRDGKPRIVTYNLR